jgi:uncharacterized protein YfaS (alpha-2-macroglobulin family)
MPEKSRTPWATATGLSAVGLVAGLAVIVALWPRGNEAVAALAEPSARAFQSKDHLLVSVNLVRTGGADLVGPLVVEVLDTDGKSLGRLEKAIRQSEAAASYRFELPTTTVAAEKLKLRVQFNGEKSESPLAKVLLVRGHETTLSASTELFAGTTTAIRCGVHGCKSFSETVPLPSAEVAIRLRSGDGKTVTVHEGRTAANGADEARFTVPNLPTGKYTLEVSTRSAFGDETLKREITVKAEPKILLTTDKPLYQPGQLIHIRALALKPMNLEPAHGSSLLFEVEDSRGNKVFKQTLPTSEYGVASADFQLASEVNMGDYQIRATLGDHQAQKTVTIKRYVLPKFKVEVKSDRGYYLPRETIHAELQADYTFGKSVANGKVKVTASTFDVAFQQFQTWEGKTDENGHVKFDITLPEYFVGQPLAKGNALVKLDAVVTDSADHSETVAKTFSVSNQPIQVSLIPEGGRLIPGMENRVFAAAVYPDGTPAECDVFLWQDRIRFDGTPNMTYTAYHGSWEMLPDFSKLKPVSTGPAVGFDLSLSGQLERFGIRFEGFLKIEKEAEYTLYLSSDDGGKLLLDGKQVAINDGCHPVTTVSTKVKLTKGMHPIEVAMFNLTGPMGLGVEIEGPDLARQDINRHVFMTAKGNPPGKKIEDVYKPIARLKTNASGLAEFRFTPDAKKFHAGAAQRQVEMLGGQIVNTAVAAQVLDLSAQARDARGNVANTSLTVQADAFGNNVLLRLDKSMYRGGDTLKADIRTSAGLPTVYLDLVRGGQTLLTRWVDVKDGKASLSYDLPAEVFGTIEVHAYQMLASGEILRDARVVYVHPAEELKISVKADRDVYRPGQDGKITFQVTNSAGKPTQAALGVIVVDEAVYALQDMQPGLEKVYFTLQKELLEPRVEVHYRPDTPIDTLVRAPDLTPAKQQVAEVLLTAVRPHAPTRWEVAPEVQRHQQLVGLIEGHARVLWQHAITTNSPILSRDAATGRWRFRAGLVDDLVKAKSLPGVPTDPFGRPIDFNELTGLEPGFTPEALGRAITQERMLRLLPSLVSHANSNRATFFKDGKWVLPENALTESARSSKLPENVLQDAWGQPIRLVKLESKWDHRSGNDLFDFYQFVSAGPDRKFDTDDDVKQEPAGSAHLLSWWWLDPATAEVRAAAWQQEHWRHRLPGMMPGFAGGRGGLNAGPEPLARMAEVPQAAAMDRAAGVKLAADAKGEAGEKRAAGGAPAATPVMRVREYFPETLLWKPSLITDEKGQAILPLEFADSITTWRLTASASSRGGQLGGVSAPLRVFQDFFVDLDLPVALTQNDEVAFPVAVYNYLKEKQTVKLELEEAPWFELVDPAGSRRSLDLKPGEVTSVKFRIKARKVGYQPLTVKAVGTHLSDALKRVIEVEPDGQKVEQIFTDRLAARVEHTLTIPESANPDASKLIVKVYPGMFSQLLEGVDGMMRMPNGCFEQTSSSAYPNIMVVDYINKARIGSPELKMKAEAYLNAGYQRLLTFERPGGGFDWWGSGPPLIWLSAYGLQEFNDMSKVYPIDRAIIDRTQKWLLSQQEPEGTWSNVGATHSETIANMGNAKLLLTSYVAWALLDSGLTVKSTPQLRKSIDYIRGHVAEAGDNAYILALVANALAAWDAKDDSTFAVLKKLDKLQETVPEWKAVCFRNKGMSLTYAHGDTVTVETTALAALAMIRSGQFVNSVNRSLTYLVKAKGNGTWGTTSATILSLKALTAGMGVAKQEGKATFSIMLDGKKVGSGEVTEHNGDVLQQFEVKGLTTGNHSIAITTEGGSNMMYQIVGRHFNPWKEKPATKEQTLAVTVDYDRAKLTTADLLRAKATVKYSGDVPTYMVIVDLGIPPGFTVDPGDFAELVAQKKVQKFSVTSRQVILYLGDVKKGDVKVFEYALRPKYPIKAQTPATVVYEYNDPKNRAVATPFGLVVSEK